MWIDRNIYDTLRIENAHLRGELRALESRTTAHDTTLDWFRVRVTQLEMERAQLLFNYTGVKIPTPVIQRTNTDDPPMTKVPNFNDMGDAAAAKLGVSWDENGELVYAK